FGHGRFSTMNFKIGRGSGHFSGASATRPSAPSIASFTCHNIWLTDIFPHCPRESGVSASTRRRISALYRSSCRTGICLHLSHPSHLAHPAHLFHGGIFNAELLEIRRVLR